MYINRTERLNNTAERVERRNRPHGSSDKDRNFSDTFQSIIEVDVVEIGGEKEKRESANKDANQRGAQGQTTADDAPSNDSEAGTGSAERPSAGLDIKI